MNRRGNCYDHAAMESWFSTLKSGLGEQFETHGEAKEKLLDYIEVFCNQQRSHSAIGCVSPADRIPGPPASPELRVEPHLSVWRAPLRGGGHA
jgi:transposase InsO family protein